jgi:hypothetical protein
MFDIIIDLPDSMGALQDLKVSSGPYITHAFTWAAGVLAACRSAGGLGTIAEESVSIYFIMKTS